jgi:hypothetical protein
MSEIPCVVLNKRGVRQKLTKVVLIVTGTAVLWTERRNCLCSNKNIVTCSGDYRRILHWMIEFIAPYIFTSREHRQYSAIADLHTLDFTVAHALWFSIFTSLIQPTDL